MAQVIEKYLDDLNAVAINDRMRYKSIYTVIEDYIFEHKGEIILGGSMSIDLLLDKPLSKDDYVYHLYSHNAFHHSNTLVNQISANIDPKSDWVVYLKTVLPHKRFDIVVDQRPLIKFVSSIDPTIIEPLIANSPFQKKSIHIMPPKFHLIELYRTLYSPSMTDNWQSALKDERRLFGYMKKIFDLKEQGISTALPRLHTSTPTYEEKEEEKEGGSVSIELKKRLMMSLMVNFITNPNIVLIGEHAIAMLTGSKKDLENKIIHCIIHKEFMPDALKQIEILVKKVFSAATNIHTSSRPVQIINDFRLKRLAMRVVLSENDATEFMYIYTASEYDLIPFNELSYKNVKVRVGNPFVLARFALIELWILNIVKSQGNIDSSYAEIRTQRMIAKVLELRDKLSKPPHKSIRESFLRPGPMQIFQSDQTSYIGVYESDDLALKQQSASANQKFGDYYPQLWFKRNGKYRTFS